MERVASADGGFKELEQNGIAATVMEQFKQFLAKENEQNAGEVLHFLFEPENSKEKRSAMHQIVSNVLFCNNFTL